jgi:glucosamine 6-phosphate synthetase-like amidotransferase/phosphosugar isomerase protein
MSFYCVMCLSHIYLDCLCIGSGAFCAVNGTVLLNWHSVRKRTCQTFAVLVSVYSTVTRSSLTVQQSGAGGVVETIQLLCYTSQLTYLARVTIQLTIE